jgi:hypothetical protein
MVEPAAVAWFWVFAYKRDFAGNDLEVDACPGAVEALNRNRKG